MKLFLRFAAALAFTFAAMGASHAARPGEPMELFLNNAINTSSGAKPSMEKVQQAMIQAGPKHNWLITRNPDGTLNAHLSVRVHTLDLTIKFHDDQYDIVYKNSTNLQYGPNPEDANRPLIHPNYTRWVKALIADFNYQFATL
jgi:hypothetical protein